MRFALSSNCCLGRFFIHFFCRFPEESLAKTFFRGGYCLPAPQRLHLSSAGPSGMCQLPCGVLFYRPLYFAKIERMYCNGKEI